MTFNTNGEIKAISRISLKSVVEFDYLGNNIASTEKDVDIRITKTWTPLDKLQTIWIEFS